MILSRRDVLKLGSLAAASTLLPQQLWPAPSSPAASCRSVAPALWNADDVNVGWIGHSTMLISIAGTTILTDPVFSDSIGLNLAGLVLGPSRIIAPALPLQHLPQPDIVLLSHAHMDHLDIPSLEAISTLWPHCVSVVTAKNTSDLVERFPWRSVAELDWDEENTFHSVNIRAIEVLHNGWRWPWEKHRLCRSSGSGRSSNAYLIEAAGRRILFGGDTAYTESLGAAVRGVDVAIMPIGAYGGFESDHCTPEQALAMATHMESEYFLPMHCNTFCQSSEPMAEPMRRLVAALPAHGSRLALAGVGQTFTLKTHPVAAQQ